MTFKVTKEWMANTYLDINTKVFNLALPLVRLKVKKNLKIYARFNKKGRNTRKGKFKKMKIWAYQQDDKIVMNKKFISEKMARDVLAHEMVHVWQDCIKDKKYHGFSFKLWKYQLKNNDIKLAEFCDPNDYK